jgi:hypothetical protein
VPTASTSAAPTAPPPSATPSQTATEAPSSSATVAQPESGGHSVVPWIIVGVGGAAIVAGVAFLVVGAGDVSTAQGACGSSRTKCPNVSAANQGNTGRTFETVGGVALGVGGAAVVGGLLWHFMEPTGSSTTAARLTPTVAPGYAGMSLRGSF